MLVKKNKFVIIYNNFIYIILDFNNFVKFNSRFTNSFDQRLPWFSFKIINFLNSHLSKKIKINVLEFGGGGSSMFFIDKKCNLTVIESSEEWYKKIFNLLNKSKIYLIKYDLNYFNTVMYINNLIKVLDNSELFDIIVLDHFENDENIRLKIFPFIISKLNKNGFIILDDPWRYFLELNDLLIKFPNITLKRFTGFGPGRIGITETCILNFTL